MTISTSQHVAVNLGTIANDGTGDDLRTAFFKVNQNFGNYEAIGISAGNVLTSGTVEAAYLKGDGSQISNLVVGNMYSNVNVASYLPSYTGSLGNVFTNDSLGYIFVGNVAQGTSKANTVVLDVPAGSITMHNAALSNGANIGFRFQNYFIKSSDVLIFNISANATPGAYQVQVESVSSGNANIRLYNVYGSSLSEAIVLNFGIISVGT